MINMHRLFIITVTFLLGVYCAPKTILEKKSVSVSQYIINNGRCWRIVLGQEKSNAYLIKCNNKFVLIDAGPYDCCDQLEQGLSEAGCVPGNLAMIIATHAHFDHIGNFAYLQKRYGAIIGMNTRDLPLVNGEPPHAEYRSAMVRIVAPFLQWMFRKRVCEVNTHFERFKPDIFLDEGYDLGVYGINAKIIDIPGHTKGSIGVLTNDGVLFSGDCINSMMGHPGISLFADNYDDLDSSIAKLKRLAVKTVYSGHGDPFPIAIFWSEYRR
jgi:hydroxyacylglutathione hydrolase